LRVLILHSLLACCVSSPFLYIVTRATIGERKPNGSLPKLRGDPYEFWGYKNKIKLIPPDSTKRRQHMEPCYNTRLIQHLRHWLLPSYVCLTALDDRLWYWSTLVLEMVNVNNNLYGQWTLKTWLGMDNGHRRCLVNGWCLYAYIHYYSRCLPWHLSRVPIWTVFQSFCSYQQLLMLKHWTKILGLLLLFLLLHSSTAMSNYDSLLH